MDKQVQETLILDFLLKNCKTSDKSDILNETTREDLTNRIYTKKLELEGDSIFVPNSNSKLKFISISSSDKNFNNVSSDDIRFSFKNYNNTWSNLFIGEVSDDVISAASEYIQNRI